MDLLKTFLDALRLTTERLVAVLLGSGLLLVAGDSVLGLLGFPPWDTWRLWAGLAFLISAASLVANGVVPVVTRSMAWRERRRRALKAFPNLSREEKEILVRFEGQRTQQIRAGKGTEVELERLGFVRRIGPGPHTDVEVYAIEDWAWEHMKKQGEFVKLAEELKG